MDKRHSFRHRLKIYSIFHIVETALRTSLFLLLVFFLNYYYNKVDLFYI